MATGCPARRKITHKGVVITTGPRGTLPKVTSPGRSWKTASKAIIAPNSPINIVSSPLSKPQAHRVSREKCDWAIAVRVSAPGDYAIFNGVQLFELNIRAISVLRWRFSEPPAVRSGLNTRHSAKARRTIKIRITHNTIGPI